MECHVASEIDKRKKVKENPNVIAVLLVQVSPTDLHSSDAGLSDLTGYGLLNMKQASF